MKQIVIRAENLSKYYKIYGNDFDRVREIITGNSHFQLHTALQHVSFEVSEGEVVGVIGRNGAGKSTLLKMLANTLQPSSGQVTIKGRIAALLELGGSFHPEMTGHDNIYLYCSIQGMNKAETDAIYDEILEFAGIGEYIHHPVKTYSSGMFVRLAFAAASHVDPDILIIDEALSVGDGIFARRSFDRIMKFKDSGKTIFFCSHSLYQVESFCDRVIWIEAGKVMKDGNPADVITAYSTFMNQSRAIEKQESAPVFLSKAEETDEQKNISGELPAITDVNVSVDGKSSKTHQLITGEKDVSIKIRFSVGTNLPLPSVGVIILGGDGRPVASAGSYNDKVKATLTEDGYAQATLVLPKLPLLKGLYLIDVYLLCEEGLHVYERVTQVAELNIMQQTLERGIVSLPHHWE